MKNTSKRQKKEFFLKKWIKKFLIWLDEKLFTSAVIDAIKPSYIPILWSFALSFIGGIIVGLHSLFAKYSETFSTVVFSIVIALILAICIWYLVIDLKRFPKLGIKIGRCAYILFWAGLSFAIGFYLAMFVLMIATIMLALWAVLFIAFHKDENKDKIRLSNGDEVTVEYGMVGEKIYTGASGKQYETMNEETFTEINHKY